MKIKKALLENAQAYDPFADMPADTKKYCRIAADVASAVYRYRTRNGWTQSELAKHLSMQQSQVSKLEAGESNMTMERLEEILDKLNYEMVIQPAAISEYRERTSQRNSWFAIGAKLSAPCGVFVYG